MQPTHLGPYEIRSRLGRGGMGAVYEAVDTATGATVAVKVLASHLVDDSGLRQRFDAEIETLKSLRAPGIVRLLAFGEQDDQPYFAMELVRGRSLDQLLRSGRRYDWRETIAIAGEITRALKVAHDHGVVHRDLKPANLLIIDAEEPAAAGAPRVKLADFGIAKLFGGVAHTAQGNVIGTAEYMAPEQASGRPVDHRADLYSLGLVMFAMLTGAPPFRGTQLTEIIDKQRRAIAPRVASVVPDVPPELDELIARLLSKEPAQRPANALSLGRLLAAIETLHTAAPVPVDEPPPRVSGPPGPTAHDRSNRATRPLAPAATADQPQPVAPAGDAGRRAAPDLLAPTLDRPARVPRPGTAAAAPPTHRDAATEATQDFVADPRAAASAGSRLPTDVASAATVIERGPRNRFTTVEEYERLTAEQARKEQSRQALWQGLATAGVVAAIAAGAWFLLKPPSADTLHRRIMAIAEDPHGDLRDARGDIDRFLSRHGDDPRSEAIRDLAKKIELDTLERRARRRIRGDKELAPIERDYRAAMAEETHGASTCVKALEAFLTVHGSTAPAKADEAAGEGDGLWADLARRQLDRLRPQAEREQQEDMQKIAKLLDEARSLAARAGIANDETARAAFVAQRRQLLEKLVQMYGRRPHAAEAVAFAKRELGDTADAP